MSIADWFLVTTKRDQPLDADVIATADQPPSKVADFITQQSFLSFSVTTAAIKLGWKGLQQPFGGWADSFWLPLALCVFFGVSQFVVSVTNTDSGLSGWKSIVAAFIATTNTLVLFAAVQGIEPAADEVGIT